MARDQVAAKVQRMLTDFVGSVRVDQEGNFRLKFDSAHIFVGVNEWRDDRTLVKVWSPVLRDVTLTPDVFRWVATEGQYRFFAHAKVLENDNGVGTIIWEHDLLGDYIDTEELRLAVASVALGADELDDELQAKFGGRRGID